MGKMKVGSKNSIFHKVLIGLAVLVIIGIVGFLVYRFNFVEKGLVNDTVSKYLVCSGGDVKHYALLEDMNGVKVESRIIFMDDGIYRVNFVISKRFSNEQLTRAFTDRLYGNYNKYLGDNNIAQKDIIMTVTNVDNVGKMVISVEGGKFINKMAPLAMLEDNAAQSGADAVQDFYEKNGFTCSIDEKDMVLSD